jgi:hypothetical protein
MEEYEQDSVLSSQWAKRLLKKMIADDETGNMVTAWSLFFPNKLQQWRAI